MQPKLANSSPQGRVKELDENGYFGFRFQLANTDPKSKLGETRQIDFKIQSLPIHPYRFSDEWKTIVQTINQWYAAL